MRLLSITGAAQVFIQIISFCCGILVIRILPTEQYALYTLANAMLGTMVVLADGGISTAVMAEASLVWQDKKKIGTVLATGLDLRRKFAVVSLVLALPLLLYFLRDNGADWLICVLIILSLIPAFLSKLSSGLLEIAPKLKQDIVPLQKNQVEVNLGRLLLTGSIFIFPYAYIAVLAAGLPQIYGNLRLRKIILKYADFKEDISLKIRKNILKYVKRTLPEAIYYSISGQLTIWLLSVFGSTDSVAQIGALGRIAMILTFTLIVFDTLITPRFSRLKSDYKLLLNRFALIQLGLILMFSAFLFIVFLFPEQILWILGPKYLHLQDEIILSLTGTSLYIFTGLTYKVCSSRGWIINPAITISVSILTIILAIVMTDVSTLKGVLFMNIIVGSVQVIMNSGYGFLKVFFVKKE